jgi:hypothetical protein
LRRARLLRGTLQEQPVFQLDRTGPAFALPRLMSAQMAAILFSAFFFAVLVFFARVEDAKHGRKK